MRGARWKQGGGARGEKQGARGHRLVKVLAQPALEVHAEHLALHKVVERVHRLAELGVVGVERRDDVDEAGDDVGPREGREQHQRGADRELLRVARRGGDVAVADCAAAHAARAGVGGWSGPPEGVEGGAASGGERRGASGAGRAARGERQVASGRWRTRGDGGDGKVDGGDVDLAVGLAAVDDARALLGARHVGLDAVDEDAVVLVGARGLVGGEAARVAVVGDGVGEPRGEARRLEARLQRPDARREVREQQHLEDVAHEREVAVVDRVAHLPALQHARGAQQPHELDETERAQHAERGERARRARVDVALREDLLDPRHVLDARDERRRAVDRALHGLELEPVEDGDADGEHVQREEEGGHVVARDLARLEDPPRLAVGRHVAEEKLQSEVGEEDEVDDAVHDEPRIARILCCREEANLVRGERRGEYERDSRHKVPPRNVPCSARIDDVPRPAQLL